MLNRSQLYTLLLARKHNGNLFSSMPRDLISLIGNVSENPQSDISTLLHYIAYGDLASANIMLNMNPRLVLQAGNVVTPSGLKVMRTTPLECALGAGDPEMAKMIEPYFEAKEIEDGAAVRNEQYARYRMHIENMMQQEPYDFTLLIATIKQASPDDVDAALNHDMTHASALRDVLTQFRNDFTPDKITAGMHFNYQHLFRAFEVYDQEFDNLFNNQNYNRNRIFTCQVIGFIQRSLPAIDRMLFAHDLYPVADEKAAIKRSLKFDWDNFDFPVTADGYSSHSGLGFDFWAVGGGISAGGGWPSPRGECRFSAVLKSFVRQERQTCKTYAADSKREDVSMCVVNPFETRTACAPQGERSRYYFPIQKLEKIRPSKSSEVNSPVISDIASCANRKSSAASSPALLVDNCRCACSTCWRARRRASR